MQSREIWKGNDILKGMIVCGYPGVGKSSIAGWHNCIDLESSNFSHCQWLLDDTNYFWEEHYVQVAEDLAKQGYTVLLSTHPGVIENVKKIDKIPVVIFCPKVEMKAQWYERLKKRYIKTCTEKDYRAWTRAMKGIVTFESQIKNLLSYDLPVIQPESIDYDLKNYMFLAWYKYGDWSVEKENEND